MLLTFQDRLRIPWSGGAKHVALDTILPAFIVPAVIFVAAINFYTALIMCLATPAFLGYTYYFFKRVKPRTQFFFMWTIWSAIYLLIIFEYTVPMMELLPEENYILIINVLMTAFCMYKTIKNAPSNFVVQSLSSEDDLPDIAEEQTSLLIESNEENDRMACTSTDDDTNMCRICRKYCQPKTYHCLICQACVLRRDHHSVWLGCCIGQSNLRHYYFGLLFSLSALFIGSDLTLTSICHPILLFRVFGVHVLIPDDCSEVFEQFDLSLAFIISIYALLMVVFVLIALIMQIYLISQGMTFCEWRRGKSGNRRHFFYNWKTFLIGNY